MMEGKLYIDGLDAYTEYGVYVQEGGFNGLAQFPPLKSVDATDWPEEDGEEPDLSAPTLDTKEISLKLVLAGKDSRWGNLLEKLSEGAYHTFHFTGLKKLYVLRLVSNPSADLAARLGFATLKLSDDFPLQGYSYAEPQSGIPPCGDYELDGRSLTDYGVRVLDGTLDEVLKSPDVKKNLLWNAKGENGAVYDGAAVAYKAKDVKVNCLMRAGTVEEFWHNRNALLYDLARRGQRTLYVDATGCEYPCYYKNCSVSEFDASGRVWMKFTLTLCFTAFRADGDEYLLASEAGELISAEDGEHCIDMEE